MCEHTCWVLVCQPVSSAAGTERPPLCSHLSHLLPPLRSDPRSASPISATPGVGRQLGRARVCGSPGQRNRQEIDPLNFLRL